MADFHHSVLHGYILVDTEISLYLVNSAAS